ncbi:hypothetical protein PHYSODRAFT_517498 [Phytophthora sojae]|uniref:Tyr recombinase domain-containing protein n=1 Tax=Phytophthora sojae (strain P6497) TaxID=1094619 RepID=G4ZWS1_PHYSP|nr:hypothetical protein PHYSODRAFT_517498 [Phytophthora sojae]EGZ12445.1 hypothetical protein PHYSODRAFT_517498 [Phytophthora sojae]|eukprot:XP_009532778.1 hypothetical protein PHYSODRAFT_517498 [Phytophthora sojae]
MDASDSGVCALHPAQKQFIQVQFDATERLMIQEGRFPINVREQLSAVWAVLCWGHDWCPRSAEGLTHITFWIDNRAAVSWCNHLSSRGPLAQELNRILGAVEAQWSLRVSAQHLPGACNTMADAGSRAWTKRHSATWQVLTEGCYSEDLLGELFALQQKSLSEASRRLYAGSWRQWTQFCKQLGVSRWLPSRDFGAQSLCMALFAAHCWSGNGGRGRLSPSTIQSKLCHVRWYHRVFAGFDPRLDAHHAMVLSGIRRANPPPARRDPVMRPVLKWIIDNLDLSKAQHRVIGGAAVLGFFFLLRSAEYLLVRGRRRVYTLQVRDVVVRDANGLQTQSARQACSIKVTFRGQKNDQEGHGMQRVLRRSGDQRFCPVWAGTLLLQNASQLRLKSTDPLCSLSTTKMLSAELMAKLLRAAAKATGNEASRVPCHSLRSGGATTLLAAGVDSTVVMLHGRWRSDVYQRYTRYTDATRSRLAARMAKPRIER